MTYSQSSGRFDDDELEGAYHVESIRNGSKDALEIVDMIKMGAETPELERLHLARPILRDIEKRLLEEFHALRSDAEEAQYEERDRLYFAAQCVSWCIGRVREAGRIPSEDGVEDD